MMKDFRNFLAAWTAILLTVFISCELIEVAKTIIANAAAAYKITTDWRIVVGSMVIAIIATIITRLVFRKREK